MSGYDASARERRSPWALSKVRQADSLLGDLFDDLEHSLNERLGDVEEYPYVGTRPPLRPRRSRAAGLRVLGIALAATFGAGFTFWMTLRPRAVVFSKLSWELPLWAEESDKVDPLLETPASPLGQESDPPSTAEAAEDSPESQAASKVSEEPPLETAKVATAPEPAPARATSPVAPAPPAPPAPVRIPTQPVPQMKLVGLIHDPGAPKALILIDNVVRQVPVGHAVQAEWRVTSISPHGVAVSNGSQSVTLQLGLAQRI